MLPNLQESPSRTQLFSVVGSAYIPEERTDQHDHAARLPEMPHRREAGIAMIWAGFYVALFVFWLVSSGAPRIIAYASTLLAR